MADVIVNHMSCDSPQFRDYSSKGRLSPFDGLFLTLDAVFPAGATEQDLAASIGPARPAAHAGGPGEWREAHPLDYVHCASDRYRCQHPQGRAYLQRILGPSAPTASAWRGWMRSVMRSRGRHQLLHVAGDLSVHRRVRALARSLGLEVLVEVHAHYLSADPDRGARRLGIRLRPAAARPACDFLPYRPVPQGVARRPAGELLTVLDTHDGIGIIDIGRGAE